MAEADTPKPPSSPPIRTMRDDLREAKRAVQPRPESFASPIRPPSPPSPASIGVRPPASPFPKEPQGSAQPRVPAAEAPGKPAKQKPDKLLVVLIVMFVLSALAAGGVWAWIFFAPNDNQAEVAIEETQQPRTLAEIIPASSLLVAYYQVSDAGQRTALAQLWETESQPTMRETLGGDIRLLLALQSVQQFAFILLPGDPRFYLAVESTEEFDQMLAERSDLQVIELGQWRVLHTFSTDLYTQALTAGTRADAGHMIQSFGKPLTLYLHQELLLELHERARTIFDGMQELALSIDFVRAADGIVVRFEGETDTSLALQPGVDVSEILAHVPDDAMFIRTQPAFSDQAYRIETPAGAQFISAFTEPYVYFERVGDDGAVDAGVVAAIPTERTAGVALPDPVVEQLLPILHTAAGLGESPAAELAFADTTYKDVAIRYVNIDTPALALDYAVLGAFLGLSTSREGMFTLVDVLQGNADNATTHWGDIENLSREFGSDRVFGLLTQPAIKRLLPAGEGQAAIPFGLSFDISGEQPAVAGVLLLQPTTP